MLGTPDGFIMPKYLPSFDLERTLLRTGTGYVNVIGFDEVGRGAIAGPVVVGACLITLKNVEENSIVDGLMDSKLVSEKKRPALCASTQETYPHYGVGVSSAAFVDSNGITNALSSAAVAAFAQLEANQLSKGISAPVTPSNTVLVLDGTHDWLSPVMPGWQVLTQVKGDRDYVSMSAASILAKVHRDTFMVSLASDDRYAFYGWDKNKGYGAKSHYEAIKQHGLTDQHRASWIRLDS